MEMQQVCQIQNLSPTCLGVYTLLLCMLQTYFLTSTKSLGFFSFCSTTSHHSTVISFLNSPLSSIKTSGQNTREGTGIICFLPQGLIPLWLPLIILVLLEQVWTPLTTFLPSALWRKDSSLGLEDPNMIYFLSFIAKKSIHIVWPILFSLSFLISLPKLECKLIHSFVEYFNNKHLLGAYYQLGTW